MSVALQVEKTSKRGGRIIHEKDNTMPPPSFAMPALPGSGNSQPSDLIIFKGLMLYFK